MVYYCPSIVLPDACAVVLALMAVVIAFIYMMSQLFRMHEWEALAKTELYQLFMSVLIVIGVIGAAYVACNISYALAGGDPFDIADGYMRTLLFGPGGLLPTWFAFNQISYSARMLDSIYYRMGPGSWCYNLKPFPGTGAIDNVASFINIILAVPFGSLIVQTFVLQFIKGTMYTLVLPAGLVLRMLPPTREAGSFLIVTAVGFYTVFPLTFAWHKAVLLDTVMPAEKAGAVAGGDWTSLDKYAQPSSPLYFARTVYTFFNPLAILKPLQDLSYIIVGGVFLPALTMIIVVTFIKGTMKFVAQKLTEGER